MKQFFNLKNLLLCFLAAFVTIVIGCNEKIVYGGEAEHDKYDGPDKAIEFEIERTHDLTTGKVPWEKLRIAIEQTQLAKESSGSNLISALTWAERGSDGDFSIGGNGRQNNDQTAGRIRAAMVDSLDPTHKTVWVGGVDGGLWKTTDVTVAPATWTLVNDFLANLAIAAICQDPRPGFQNIMYFCTGESYGNADAVRGVGVYKSIDAGATWSFLPSTSSYLNGTRILCDFQGNVYLGTRGAGLLRSTDGGTTWTTITPTGIGSDVCDLEISSTSAAGRLHVATGIFSTAGYRYTDIPSTVTSGAGWTTATTPYTTFSQRTELGISGNNLYACPANGSYQVPTIWKSIDGGANWTAVTTQPSTTWASGQGWYSLSCAINPADPNQCIVGGLDTWKTTNGGTSWTHLSGWVTGLGVSQYVHADQHNIQWWDGGNKLMFTSDGGVFYTSDGGTTIRDRNKGLRLKQFYSVAIHPTLTNHFIAGAQDNGMHRLNHPGLDSSVEVVGGDGCYAAIDQDEPQYQYGSYVYNVYRRSTSNGNNNTWTTPVNNQATGRFVNPWDLDNTANIIYACNNAGTFLRWNDPHTGASTEVVSVSGFSGQNVSAVYASPYTANRVYFGTGNGLIVQIDNANTGTSFAGTVINSGSGMPGGYVNCIVAGSDDQHLLACFTNYGVSNIWSTTNGGTTWTAIDGNLPDMPVRWALYHPDTDTKAYIATETGVWETDLINGASTVWVTSSTFPTVRTDMIKYRTSDRTIAAGTHGRGIWTATVPGAACTPASIATNPVNSTICATQNTTFSVVASGTAPLGYQWQVSTTGCGGAFSNISNGGVYSGATSATLTITGATTAINGYGYRCVVTGNCAPLTATSTCALLTVNAATAITVQPPPTATVCAPNPVTIPVTATGTSLTYQWQLSTNGGGTWSNLVNGAPYSGVTTASMTINPTASSMNGYQYRCIVTGTCGPLTSNVTVLTVNAVPAITSQPVNVSSCAGNLATFGITATGSGLTYQWQESTNGGGTWNNLTNVAPYSNVTTATLSINPTALGMNNYQYRCIVTGSCAPAATSNAAILTVGAAMAITVQPVNAAACVGQNASFSITTSGTVLGYQWQESINGGGTWNNITNGGIYSGATTNTVTLTGVTAGMNNYQYRCVINGNCANINSAAGILTINTAPAITSQPVASTICATQNSSFTVAATGSSLTYQWQVSTAGCAGPWSNLANGAPYSGVTTATLSITGATTAINGYGYRCVVTGVCAPLTATSNCALLTVNTPVNITTQPVNSTICAGQNTSFIVAATGSGLTYQWQESTNGGGTWNNITNGGIYGGATTTTLALTGVTAGMNNYQYRCIVSGAAGCSAANSTAGILTVNTAAAITAQPANSTICVSQTTLFSVTATGTGITYQWQESTTGCGGPWANVANGGVYSGATTNTLTLTGVPTGMTGYGYRCIVTGTCAPAATSNCGLLTVNTAVNISSQPVSSTICAGQNTSFIVAATGSGLTYQWQESTNGGGTWNNITNGGIYGGATTTTLTLTGVTAVMNNNQYRCIVSGGAGCTSATSTAAVLTVNTAPAITAQPVNSTICATQTTSFSVTANGTAITYQWQESTAGCAGPWTNVANGGVYSGATTNTLTITGAPNTMNGFGYRCIITGTCAPAATSNCGLLTVNTPLNITTQPANSTVCAGANTTFSVVVTGTTPTYQWQESTNGGGTWNNITNGGVYGGATTNTLALTAVTAGMTGYQYRCVVTAATACAATNSGSATLTVNTAPAITTQPATGAAVCAGQVKTYSVVANGTALTYQWQESTNGGTTWNPIINGGIYSGATTATLTLTGVTVAMNNNQYRCVISGTCAPAATSAAVTITVYTPITITTAPANATICATGTTSFSVLAAGTTPAYQWQESSNGGTTWNNVVNGGIYSGAATTTLTLTGVTAGMNGYLYRAVVTGAAPCSIVNTVSAILTVSPQPFVTLTASPYTKLLPGRTTTITASVNPVLPFSAVWTLNGTGITPTGNTYTADVDHLGTYTVVATIGTCTSLPASIIISDSASSKLWVYPSPNDGAFTVSYYTPGATSTNKVAQKLTIYDTEGRLVYKKDLSITQPYNLEKVDMRRNRGGLYYVVLRDANGKQIKTGQVVIK